MEMKVTFVISDATVFGELTLGAFSRVLLPVQWKNNFLSISKHWRAKLRLFLAIFGQTTSLIAFPLKPVRHIS